GDPIERMLYGFSILHCLPAGRDAETSAATGTVMRPDVFERYAREAGFSSVEVLDVDHPMFRFYRPRATTAADPRPHRAGPGRTPAGGGAGTAAATGAVVRPGVFVRYAREAGFSSVEVLDVDHPMFRFYRPRA